LDGGSYSYLWLDALSVKAREEGRVTTVATIVATAVSADGHREIPGLDTFTAEDGPAWTRFLKDLASRGLSGVRLVISDDHRGLVGAIAAVLPGASQVTRRTLPDIYREEEGRDFRCSVDRPQGLEEGGCDLMGANPMDLLTHREAQVLAMFSAGMITKTVASELGISPQTVRTHARSIYRELGVTNRVQAILLHQDPAPWAGPQTD
jgi:DNA-binding CsgD family transcriptional regulator